MFERSTTTVLQVAGLRQVYDARYMNYVPVTIAAILSTIASARARSSFLVSDSMGCLVKITG